MRHNRDQVKATLLAEAEVMIEELLEWDENTPTPTLTQLEDVLLKLRQRLSERMAEVVLREQEATRPVPGPLCPTCHQEMGYKGMKEVTVEGRVGLLRLERSYHYCNRCKSGLFPPRSATAAAREALE